MAKPRKSAKRTTAKKKSAGTTKSKRAASTRAKATSAKRGTAKRTASKRRMGADPCRRERDDRNRVAEEIRSIEEQLSDFDIPRETRRRLETLLRQKNTRLRFVQRKLDECKVKHGNDNG